MSKHCRLPVSRVTNIPVPYLDPRIIPFVFAAIAVPTEIGHERLIVRMRKILIKSIYYHLWWKACECFWPHDRNAWNAKKSLMPKVWQKMKKNMTRSWHQSNGVLAVRKKRAQALVQGHWSACQKENVYRLCSCCVHFWAFSDDSWAMQVKYFYGREGLTFSFCALCILFVFRFQKNL